jgi:hypothetical protein
MAAALRILLLPLLLLQLAQRTAAQAISKLAFVLLGLVCADASRAAYKPRPVILGLSGDFGPTVGAVNG